MKKVLVIPVLLLALLATVPQHVRAEQQPEMIGERMAIKLTRGFANIVLSPLELPKQFDITIRDMGAAGFLIGPLKGIGMTIYRGFVGIVEISTFVVPQPGYYDPLMDPPYVWNGWESKKDTRQIVAEENK